MCVLSTPLILFFLYSGENTISEFFKDSLITLFLNIVTILLLRIFTQNSKWFEILFQIPGSFLLSLLSIFNTKPVNLDRQVFYSVDPFHWVPFWYSGEFSLFISTSSIFIYPEIGTDYPLNRDYRIRISDCFLKECNTLYKYLNTTPRDYVFSKMREIATEGEQLPVNVECYLSHMLINNQYQTYIQIRVSLDHPKRYIEHSKRRKWARLIEEKLKDKKTLQDFESVITEAILREIFK